MVTFAGNYPYMFCMGNATNLPYFCLNTLIALMRQLFLFCAATVFLFSCNDNKPEQDATIAPLTNTKADTALNSSGAANQILPRQMPANPTAGMPPTTVTAPQNVPTGTTAAGMNPEHGKPGHRCDITVGAPLSSAAARTATTPTTVTQPTTITQPAMTQPTIAPAKTVTAKGMNPAHGEPGHRCDITVGAPLNSAPTNAAKPTGGAGAANITPMPASTQNNTAIVPALQNTSITAPAKTATAFTGKVNPAHGQPGHDCKVAVGQPLP